uniref:Uncharacterized protein n=1 Tax=viral metagenome TaxID=1070528 RepID=A0A6C0FDH2_9ZZZZ|tara:strand:- start:4088 stop:4900 length:813 start_codon:yes stop_codon:yes gene_type:complete
MIKIIDCFTFYNELELLKYRLNILNEVVDYFVLVESTHTHVGKEKPLFYQNNKNLFEKFNNKIIHIIIDDFPHKFPNINIANNEQWINEKFQRDAILKGIQFINGISNTDVIVIADIDEIPDPNTLANIKTKDIMIDHNVLVMDMYYYNLYNKCTNKWKYSKIISYKKYNELDISCDDIRSLKVMKNFRIHNGGWHLSYFGDEKFIQNKIQNFGHQEFNKLEYTDLNNIAKRVNNYKDLYDRKHHNLKQIKLEDNNYLPINYDIFLKNYF